MVQFIIAQDIMEANMTKKRKVSDTISFKNSIKTKLIAIMVLVAAIPLIVAIVISYNTSTKKAKSDALELLAAQAANVEKDYSNVINQNIIALETFANSASAREYLLTRGTAAQRISDDEILKEYVSYRASMLGIQPVEITSKLNESYSISDVNKICDTILTEGIVVNRLPYGVNSKSRVAINESKTVKPKVTSSENGYEIDDSLLELAGLK